MRGQCVGQEAKEMFSAKLLKACCKTHGGVCLIVANRTKRLGRLKCNIHVSLRENTKMVSYDQ